MSDVVIKVENLSKQYRLGAVGTGTISHDLNRLWAKIRGKEDPYLRIGEKNDRTKKGNSEYVWALRDINFEVKRGEVLGIIGRNGAGKSTLLKILSQITRPTTGNVKMKGRVGSLLEVGTGFHPDLTGRENIYINGAILGMRKWEIDKKLDEIIDFAGVEKYIDTPVKRYSSGMTVRLGFSVAAHLEPEILIIDEVLAVGDMEFQNKAILKMQKISESENCTLIFVSHDLDKMEMLTKRCLLIKNGELFSDGKASNVIQEYSRRGESANQTKFEKKGRSCFIRAIKVGKDKIFINESLDIEIELEIEEPIKDPGLSVQIVNWKDVKVLHFLVLKSEMEFGNKSGVWKLNLSIPLIKLYPDQYYLIVSLGDNSTKVNFDRISGVGLFKVIVPEHMFRDFYWYPGEAMYIDDCTWSVDYADE